MFDSRGYPRSLLLFYEAALYRATYYDDSGVRDLYLKSEVLTTIIRFLLGVFYITRDLVKDYTQLLFYFNSKRDVFRRSTREDTRHYLDDIYPDNINYS